MIQFDLRNRLPFNVDRIYAHGEAESILAKSRQEDESYPDLISCNLDFNSLLIESQVCNAVFECNLQDIPAVAIVWECSDYANRARRIKADFDENIKIYTSIHDPVPMKDRERGIRLATQHFEFELRRCVPEYKGLVCTQSDSPSIQDALTKLDEIRTAI